jgi:hypothetical protein
MVVLWPLYGATVQQYRRYIMVININGHLVTSDNGPEGEVIVSDPVASASGVINIMVMTEAVYNALGSYDANTLYFLT